MIDLINLVLPIERIEVLLVEAKVKKSVITGSGLNYNDRPLLLIKTIGNGVVGYGECQSLPLPTYSSEYTDASLQFLTNIFIPKLLKSPITISKFENVAHEFKNYNMAKSSILMALYDFALKLNSISLKDYLGITSTTIVPGSVVGRRDTIDDLLDDVSDAYGEGYRRVKLKIAPGFDVAPVESVRNHFDDLEIFVDANGSYENLKVASNALIGLDELNVTLVEQPFEQDEIISNVRLGGHIKTPISLDESIVSATSLKNLTNLGACDVVTVKVGKVGGIGEVQKISSYLKENGLKGYVGGMFSSGIGICVDLVLASLPGLTLSPDVATFKRGLDIQICEPVRIVGGKVEIPCNVGLGKDFDLSTVSSRIIKNETFVCG